MAEVPQASVPQAVDHGAMDVDQEAVPGLNDKIEIVSALFAHGPKVSPPVTDTSNSSSTRS